MYFLGYDVGGTKIEAALFSQGKHEKALSTLETQTLKGGFAEISLLAKLRVPTERHLGYEQIIAKMSHLASTLCGEFGVHPANLLSVGLGVPGSIEPQTQVYLNGSAFALKGKSVGKDLAAALGISAPVLCENDANCFALAEALGGAGVEYSKIFQRPLSEQVSVGIILGTGVGGGFVVRGKLLSGVRGGAAEIGHSVLYPNGLACYCGRSGCAEMYLGGPALEASFAQRRYSQIDSPGSALDIFRLAHSYEPASIAVLHEYKRNLARFMGNLATFLDPDYFVLGGGLSLQESIYSGLSEEVAKNAFISEALIPIYQHRLGDSSGVVGAALLGLSAV
jgi:predicted NBD/HSP70 family sugar kinase